MSIESAIKAIHAAGLSDTQSEQFLSNDHLRRIVEVVISEQWEPIETAPRGLVLFCDMNASELRNSFFVDWMVDGKFCGNRHHTATHWHPLPNPPETKA